METSGLIKVIAGIRWYWTDCRLKWNPSDYGEVTNLVLSNKAIWTPDVVLYDRYMTQYLRLILKQISSHVNLKRHRGHQQQLNR